MTETVIHLGFWELLIGSIVTMYMLIAGGWVLAKAGRSPLWILLLLFPYINGADFARRFKAQRPGRLPYDSLPASTEQLMHDSAYFGKQRDIPSLVELPHIDGTIDSTAVGAQVPATEPQPAASQAPQGSGLPRYAPPPRTLRAFWPVFALLALGWIGMMGYLLRAGAAFGRIVDGVRHLAPDRAGE